MILKSLIFLVVKYKTAIDYITQPEHLCKKFVDDVFAQGYFRGCPESHQGALFYLSGCADLNHGPHGPCQLPILREGYHNTNS